MKLGQLRLAGIKPTAGDIRCITFGHLTRMAIWMLRPTWDVSAATTDKLGALGPYQVVIDILASVAENRVASTVEALPLFHKDERDAVSF